jgi:hypothetical protein
MTTVSIEEFCQALACAFIRAGDLRPGPDDRIAFVARRPAEQADECFRVEFDGVRDLVTRSRTSPPSGDDIVELSILELDGEPDRWRVRFHPWYLHEIEFRCRRIRVNAAEVTGRGRHLQDWYPQRRPKMPPFRAGVG